jgi:general stress protein 26
MEKTQSEHFRNLLEEFDTAVLITHGQRTHFHSRPMAIAHVEENCDLWFITSENAAKVHEIEADARAHVVCQNGRFNCVTVSGHASIVRDRARIDELWKPAYRVWFPEGVSDPSIVLIHLAGEHGEYWDNTGTEGIAYVYRAIKAAVTGTTPRIAEGEQHGHVSFADGR